MNAKMTEEILIKFLNNRCSDTELKEVIRWVNAEAFKEEGRGWVLNDWNSYRVEDNTGDDEKFSALFDKIRDKIDQDNKEHKIEDFKTSPSSVFIRWMTRAAAILLIPVLGFLLYTLSGKQQKLVETIPFAANSVEVIAPVGSRTIVQLSDGSVVHLNYGSSIKYPQFFTGDTREVMLTGEAYFDVSHNPEKPFIVTAGNLTVEALGTAFNVLAYPDNHVIETTLVNGKVVLEQNDADGKTESIGVMVPGQHVKYNSETGTVRSTRGSVEKYIAWKDGKIVFDDTPITVVAERLSRMFNVDIEVADDLEDYIFTVTFIDEPLFQILDLMTIAAPVTYTALPRKKLPDGTFSKQKIVIEKEQ